MGEAGTRRRAGFCLWAVVSGVVSAAVFLAVSEALSLIFGRGGSPIIAVGGFVIDIVPQPFKEFAIATFGEYDKIALIVGLALAVLVASSIAGILQAVRPPLGVAALGLAGVLAIAAIVTRAGASPLVAVPAAAGAVAGGVTLASLARKLRGWKDAAAPPTPQHPGASQTSAVPENPAAPKSPAALNRRAFFLTTAIAGASAVLVGMGARVLSAATSSIDAVRGALTLPAARSKVTIPAGAELDIEGISPLITPNADFYRVDTALTVPEVDPSTWRLVIDGMVDERVEIGFDELVAMGLDEYAVTMTCVSNEVGGGLLGNALWLGVPVRDVLARARPQSGADMVLSRSVDGYTASTPLEALTDENLDAILAVGMNGEPLPLEHGFPVRMVVPGLYGYVSATKWLTELKVTTFADDEAYWTPRGYSAKAPIKLSSRIDTPTSATPVTAGKVAVAGVAWAQPVGIDRVEVNIDDAGWQPATLSTPINDDTWVQWYVEWDATPGTHYIAVRATDKRGTMQTQERAPIAPDGSTGWQRILITVR